GYRAGLLAGALTSMPTLVAAQDAVRDGVAVLPPGFEPGAVTGNLAASYAISYVIGTFGLLLLVSVAPRALGIDLKGEARRGAADRVASGVMPERRSQADTPILRVYQATRDDLVGMALDGASRLQRAGCFPQSIKRDGVVSDVTPETRLRRGDLVSVLGVRAAQRTALALLGAEAIDEDLLAVGPEVRTILVARPRRGDRTAPTLGTALVSGCSVVQLTRAGLALPVV